MLMSPKSINFFVHAIRTLQILIESFQKVDLITTGMPVESKSFANFFVRKLYKKPKVFTVLYTVLDPQKNSKRKYKWSKRYFAKLQPRSRQPNI